MILALFKSRKKATTPGDQLTTTVERKVDTSKFGLGDAASFYLKLITTLWSKGRSESNLPEHVIGDKARLGIGKYFYASNRIFTHKGVKKMYFLKSMPSEMDWGWVDDVRTRILNVVDQYNTNNNTLYHATVNLVINGKYFNFDYTDRRIQGRWKQLTRMYDKVNAQAQTKTLADELKNDKWDAQVRHKVNSFLYMQDRKDVQQASFFNTVVALEIVVQASRGREDDLLYLCEDQLNEYLVQTGIQLKPVFLQANEYQRSFTPAATPDRKSLLKDMNKGSLWTDEIIASFSTLEHGHVGDRTGVLHGMDIQSNEDVVFDLKAGSDGLNALVTAATGQGKSGYTKMLFTFLAKDPDYQTIVFDYEGSEYLPLGRLFDATVVGFDGRSGSYVNTLVIDDPVGDKDLDDARLQDSIEATMRVFNILFKKSYGEFGMTDAEVNVFNAVLNQCYDKFGIDRKNPKTWSNSKNLSFHEYYLVLDDMINSDRGSSTLDLAALAASRPDGDGMAALREFKLTLSNYFENSGAKSYWFKHPIALGDIVRAKNVILSFNMGQGGESAISNDNQQLALNQLFAGELTLKKARYNKSRGIFTVTMIEEMQRYLKLQYSIELVSKLVTGGRKLNLINYLITNSPAELFNDEARGTTEARGIEGIVGNINMLIIGALDRTTMAKVLKRFNLGNAQPYLLQLARIKDSETSNSPYKYSFFIKKGNQSTVVKQMIHPELAELPLYMTVEHNKDEDDSEEQLRGAVDMSDEEMRNRINQTYTDLKEDDESDRLRKNVKDNVLLRQERQNMFNRN